MVTTTKPVLLALSVVLFGLLLAAKVQGDYVDIGDKKYLIKSDKKVNWYKANQVCTLAGMSLDAIESEAEYTNLKNYLYNNNLLGNTFWLSGSNLADATTPTIHTWLSTGNKLDYTNWKSAEPSASASFCVFIDTDFKWSTADCAAGTNYVICSRPHVPDCGITGRCKINRNFFF